ncbi:MAG: hypothetical protein WCO26_07950 [Deltaproteobacteria bacterium]
MEKATNFNLTSDGSVNPFVKSTDMELDVGKHRGLCTICEDHGVCTYPKPEGGVWHCEEYR